MAQQTALQQLIEWAVSLKNNSQQCTDWICIKEKAEELLQMEKEQISQGYMSGLIDGMNHQPKEYYNRLMEKNNMTAVEWLSDKYNLITWLRNRDEISPEAADEMRKSYLIQAKQMEKEQIGNAWVDGYKNYKEVLNHSRLEQYYNETFGKQ